MRQPQAMIVRTFLLLVGAACLIGCGPSSESACEDCEGQDLIDCEETYDLCKDVKRCHKRHVRADYARGLCTAPTMDQACDGCQLNDWSSCRTEYAACDVSGTCSDEMRKSLRAKYAQGVCAPVSE